MDVYPYILGDFKHLRKEAGVLITAGMFIRINTVFRFHKFCDEMGKIALTCFGQTLPLVQISRLCKSCSGFCNP